MKERIECVVSGRVQGVLYRDFARRHARRLGLVGTVRNRREGVEVIAEGEPAALETFLALLRKGPAFARVEDITVSRGAASGSFMDFSILYANLLDRL